MDKTWDVIVIGGGAAGLSAALMLGRARRRTLVLDAGSPRNRFAAHMHGVLGHDGLDPAELLALGRREVAGYGVEVRSGVVERLDEDHRTVRATLSDGSVLTARAAVVATGVSDDLPDVPGLAERWGSQVLHCPYCHGWEVRDGRLGVLATSPMSLHQAELVRQWSDTVTVFTAGLGPVEPATEHRLRARGLRLVPSPVVEVGEDDGALLVRTADDATVALDAVFTGGVLRPHDGFLAHLDLARTETPAGSTLAVDMAGRTSSARIWAAGNVTVPMANVPMSVSAGATAGATLNAALTAEDFDDAVAATPAPDVVPADFWEDRYAGAGSVWSGRANATLVDVVGGLRPGRALDLGCGEGGDAIWLAGQGWDVVGVDIARTAVERATAAARTAELDGRARFEVADLGTWQVAGPVDLVTASFFQSPVTLPRAEILRRAADAVAPGGHLLVLTHAAAPPWADDEHAHRFHALAPQEELDALSLKPDAWEPVLVETRPRATTAPDGTPATLDDGVVLLRRR